MHTDILLSPNMTIFWIWYGSSKWNFPFGYSKCGLIKISFGINKFRSYLIPKVAFSNVRYANILTLGALIGHVYSTSTSIGLFTNSLQGWGRDPCPKEKPAFWVWGSKRNNISKDFDINSFLIMRICIKKATSWGHVMWIVICTAACKLFRSIVFFVIREKKWNIVCMSTVSDL